MSLAESAFGNSYAVPDATAALALLITRHADTARCIVPACSLSGVFVGVKAQAGHLKEASLLLNFIRKHIWLTVVRVDMCVMVQRCPKRVPEILKPGYSHCNAILPCNRICASSSSSRRMSCCHKQLAEAVVEDSSQQ